MRRKDYIAGTALLLALSVAGCGSNVPGSTTESSEAGHSTEAATEASSDAAQAEAADDSGAEDEAPAEEQEPEQLDALDGVFKIAYKTEQVKYEGSKKFADPSLDDSNGVLLDGQYVALLMDEQYADAFPKLYETISSKASDKINNVGDVAKKAKEQAVSDYEEAIDNGYGFMGHYYYKENMRISRADNTVLSIVNSFDEFYGGFHNLYNELGCTYDTQTGAELKLDEIVKCSEEELDKILADELHVTEVDENQFMGLEDSLAHYKYNPDTSNNDDYEKSQFPYNWYLGGDGLHFIFNPYELTSYVYGASDVVIGYDEYEGIIDEKFVPDTDGGYINAEHTFVAEEGNGDATEGIYISCVKDGDYQENYTPAKAIILTLDGKSATIEKKCNVTYDFADYYYVHRKDGTTLIYLILPEDDDCYDLLVFDITDGTPKAVRSGTYRKNAEELDNGFKAYKAFTDSEKEYEEQMGDTEIDAADIQSDNSEDAGDSEEAADSKG
ncbi:MAG: DUF3298 and DUF4163 domain-containing protein [Butyrivibrio sp.]|nr:DUF3298 and DUF4163 domain-containing protein [Butyrivibrio sp.]